MAGFYQAKSDREEDEKRILEKGIPKISLWRFIDYILVNVAEEANVGAAREVFYKLVEEHGLVVYDMSGLTEYDESNRGQVVSPDALLDALRKREGARQPGDYLFEFWKTMDKESRYCVFRDDVAKAFNHAGDQDFHWIDWDLNVKKPSEALTNGGAGSQSDNVPLIKNVDPWLIRDPKDPEPAQSWYTPARYFARQIVREDSTLLGKRDLLARRVVQSLTQAGIKKRGGIKPFDPVTIKKALSNVSLGESFNLSAKDFA